MKRERNTGATPFTPEVASELHDGGACTCTAGREALEVEDFSSRDEAKRQVKRFLLSIDPYEQSTDEELETAVDRVYRQVDTGVHSSFYVDIDTAARLLLAVSLSLAHVNDFVFPLERTAAICQEVDTLEAHHWKLLVAIRPDIRTARHPPYS